MRSENAPIEENASWQSFTAPAISKGLKFFSWLVMIGGVIFGITIIVMLAPETDILGDAVEGTGNALRWPYGISLMFSSIVSGFLIHGFAYVIDYLHEIRNKV